MRTFYHLLANNAIAGIVNFTVWFAITFFTYLQTQSVMATSIISGLYLVATALSGFWLGGVVDHNNKKTVMLISSVISLTAYVIGFALYQASPAEAFTRVDSATLWIFIPVLMTGVIAGNLRNIAMTPLVSILVPEKDRDKANGLSGTVFGITFFVTSIISGLLVGNSGMFLVLILAILVTIGTIAHLMFVNYKEKIVKHTDEKPRKLDIKGTIRVIKEVPGLPALILFTMFNNFLGGVFMSLMDAYGLSLVSVEVWGLMWGILSCSFIVGGLLVTKFGLGKSPLRSMFLANIVIWTISIFFTIQPWIWLLVAGMFIYLCVMPYIEASEQTIIQKVIPVERQGRVMGFAHSVEQAASPLTAFAIGPLTQLVFIPFMSDGGRGAEIIGSWFGVGPNRGIALVFTTAGIIGLIVTILAMRSRFYRMLDKATRRS